MTFYKNIQQEPYIINKYVRPKGLPVHKYEAIKSEQEIEFQKRKLIYLLEEQDRVRNEQIKNQYGVLRGAMIREMTDGNILKPRESSDNQQPQNMKLNPSASVPGIQGVQKIESNELYGIA